MTSKGNASIQNHLIEESGQWIITITSCIQCMVDGVGTSIEVGGTTAEGGALCPDLAENSP
jgi:hypothetical protein